MNKTVFIALFVISILGNILTLATIGYGYYFYKSHVSNNATSHVDGGDTAIVEDVLSYEDPDGYSNRNLIAMYHKQRIVIPLLMPANLERHSIKTGDAVDIQVIRAGSEKYKILQFMLAPSEMTKGLSPH